MTVIETYQQRNAAFVKARFDPALKIIPTTKTLILGCVDPRVDPGEVLGLTQGEAAVIRNVGGRVTPDVVLTLAILARVAKAGGGALGTGWNLVVLHHSDCGITRVTEPPAQLAGYLGVEPTALPTMHVHDPRASVAIDVAMLKASPELPGGFVVTGLVYDVATGLIETVVPSALLRP